MLQRVFASILALTLVGAGVPLSAATAKARQGEATGRISGVAVDAARRPLPNHTIRVRNVDNGQIVAEQKTNARGEYLFTGLPVGRYVVEVVDDKGAVIGSTAAITLTAGAMTATGVTITATAATAGAGTAAAAAGAAGGGFFSSTAGIIVLAAAGAGIAGGIAIAANASPSR